MKKPSTQQCIVGLLIAVLAMQAYSIHRIAQLDDQVSDLSSTLEDVRKSQGGHDEVLDAIKKSTEDIKDKLLIY